MNLNKSIAEWNNFCILHAKRVEVKHCMGGCLVQVKDSDYGGGL